MALKRNKNFVVSVEEGLSCFVPITCGGYGTEQTRHKRTNSCGGSLVHSSLDLPNGAHQDSNNSPGVGVGSEPPCGSAEITANTPEYHTIGKPGVPQDPNARQKGGKKCLIWTEKDVVTLVNLVERIKATQGLKRVWRNVQTAWNALRGHLPASLDNTVERSKEALCAKYRSYHSKRVSESSIQGRENTEEVSNLNEDQGVTLIRLHSEILDENQGDLGELSKRLKRQYGFAMKKFTRKPLSKPKHPIPEALIRQINCLIGQFIDDECKGRLSIGKLNSLVYAAGEILVNHSTKEKSSDSKGTKRTESELVQKEKRLRTRLAWLQDIIQSRESGAQLSKTGYTRVKKLRKEFNNLERLCDFRNLKETLVNRARLIHKTILNIREERERRRVRNMAPRWAINANDPKAKSKAEIPLKKVYSYWSEIIGVERQFKSCKTLEDWRKSIVVPTLSIDMETSREGWEQVRKASRPWKATGPDGIPNWLWKHLPRANEELYKWVFGLLAKPKVPVWFSQGRAVLLYKKGDPSDPGNYRTIVCLNTCYKWCSGLIAYWVRKQIVNLPYEQKACKKGVWGCTEAHILDATIVKDAVNQRKRELSMAWIDFSKAFDSVPHKYVRWVLNGTKLHSSVRRLLMDG